MKRKQSPATQPTPPPTVPNLVLAPELAAIILLEHALDVAAHALLAEHPTLIDDFAIARDNAPVLSLASRICFRATALADTLRRYRRAVYDAARAQTSDDDDGSDLPF